MEKFGPPRASLAAMKVEAGHSKNGSYVTPEGVNVHVLEDTAYYRYDGYFIDDFTELGPA